MKHFDHVERFFENQQAIGSSELLHDFLPGIIRVRRADHHLQIRIDLPQFVRGLNAIPAGGHPHIHKRNRKAPVLSDRLEHQFQAFFALGGAFQLEVPVDFRRRSLAIQFRLGGLEFMTAVAFGRQNFAEIIVDGAIVIDDEQPPMG